MDSQKIRWEHYPRVAAFSVGMTITSPLLTHNLVLVMRVEDEFGHYGQTSFRIPG